MQNSTYDPSAESEYSKKFLNVDFKGVSGTATAGTSTSIDHTLTDDVLLVGSQVLAAGSVFGDSCDFQVVHPEAGVLKQFVSSWGVSSDNQEKINMNSIFPAKIPAGLILRFVYHSTGEANVSVLINYKLYKVLV
jgi:hypothetical protein